MIIASFRIIALREARNKSESSYYILTPTTQNDLQNYDWV